MIHAVDARDDAEAHSRVEAHGVTIRPFHAPADFEALVRIYSASKAADGFDRARSAEELASTYAAFGIDPEKVGYIAEAAGQSIGYVVGADDGRAEEVGRRLFHVGLVVPEWRRRGIGSELLRRVQSRLLEAFPTGDDPASFTTDLRETQHGAIAMLEGDDYRPVRYSFAMVRGDLDDLPPVELPEGIGNRPVRRDEALRIFAAMDEAMRDEWSWTPLDASQMTAASQHPLFGQVEMWQVAWDGDEPVGGVLGWIDEKENEQEHRLRGYTEGIWVRRPWRGRGIASALIARNLHELKRRGMTEAALSVDADNPSGALRLYEKHGFRRDHTEIVYARPIARRSHG